MFHATPAVTKNGFIPRFVANQYAQTSQYIKYQKSPITIGNAIHGLRNLLWAIQSTPLRGRALTMNMYVVHMNVPNAAVMSIAILCSPPGKANGLKGKL